MALCQSIATTEQVRILTTRNANNRLKEKSGDDRNPDPVPSKPESGKAKQTAGSHATAPRPALTPAIVQIRPSETDILLAPAARAEFIVTGPAPTVNRAALMTLNIDTGPDGDNDPTRPIATVIASAAAQAALRTAPRRTTNFISTRFIFCCLRKTALR
jgi:hypothetical protein